MKKKAIKDENLQSGIFDSSIEKIMSDRFGRYAKYIIQDRALPDVRDGLKPVQRRILYALSTLNLNYDTPPKKSARIVGEVIGKYHPHGDTAVYEAMVRMSQNWKLLFPLVDMQGNNGSIDGDGPAAMRYTEARLAKISQLLLNDLDKKTVPMAPNFDDSESEPTVLPALFPNILVNGSSGIAAGYATNIPPHNLGEIIDATILLIQEPHTKLDALLNIIKGPDFPTGGVVHGREGIRQAFQTGKGKITLSAKWHAEANKIVIDEIPYEVVKQDLIRKIGDLIDLNPGLAVRDVRDETDRTGLRIVIELDSEGKRDTVRKFLFKNTALSVNFNYNNVVIVEKQPKLLGLIAILNSYIEHLRAILTRKSEFEYEKAKKRLEIIKGLIKMTGKIGQVIKIIRHSANRQEAIHNLKKMPFRFSEVQATAIVDMRLYRLSATDVKKLESEKEELQKEIHHLHSILEKPEEMNKMMVASLTEIKEGYGKARKTDVEEVSQDLDITVKDTMIEKDFNLWVSRDGYIKAVDSTLIDKNTWETFGRKPEDLWIGHREVSNFNYLLLISNWGSYYSIPLYKIPLSKWTDPGVHINTIVTMQPNEKLINAFVVPDYEKATQHLLIASKNGLIKRVVISCLATKIFSKSFRIMRLEHDDQIVTADLITSRISHIFVASSNGHGVRYEIKTIPLQTPGSKGVRALNLKTENLAFATALHEKDNILFITSRASYKKIPQGEIPIKVRPKRGINLYSKGKNKEEAITAGLSVSMGDKINFLSNKNQTEIINSDDLSLTNINTKTLNWKLPILDLAAEELALISSDDFPIKPDPEFDNNVQCAVTDNAESEK